MMEELNLSKNEKHIGQLNEFNYDLNKLLINKINVLGKQSVKSKSRSGSIDEILYSPIKHCSNEPNFYKATNDSETIDNETVERNQEKRADQIRNPIDKLLQFKHIKQLNDLLLLNSIGNRITFNEQFEKDSLYSSSSEPNRGWQLDDGEFILQCLNRHNYLRKLHHVPNLNLSKNLINYSRDWAEILARNDRLEKRFSNRFGESVFVMQLDDESTNLNGAIPVDHWYHQGANYDYTSQYPKNSTSAFTQLIWKHTKYLGVACARSKTNRIFP